MTFEEAFWITFKIGMRTGSDHFLDNLKIHGRDSRRLARKAAKSDFGMTNKYEPRFKMSDTYKILLSSILADPLYYTPILEEILKKEIKFKNEWLKISETMSNGMDLDIPRKSLKNLNEAISAVRSLIQ